MAADTKLPGEVDDGVVAFRDLPGKKEYVVVTDVPVLDEHLLTGDANNEEEWIGPERLAEIAENNNKRIRETGDATPITIGHTKDGVKETEQPEVVGFATDFKVAPLLNANRMAIYATFHLLRDKLDEVKNYPRRSVELWPKRWEIDPIALLGATTPERDLGLLQLDRGGRPIRYRRVLNEEPDMADEMDDKEEGGGKPPKKDKKPPKAKEAAEDGADDGGELGSSEEKIAQRVLALLMESGPFKELMAAAQGQAPGGGEGGDYGMGSPTDQPPMGGMPPEMGGGGPGGPGGHPEHEAAFMHQGPPERYEHECDYDDDEEPERYSGYASPTNTYMPDGGEHTMDGHRSRGYAPYAGDAFYEDYEERPMRKQTARERYERYLYEQEQEQRRRMAGRQQTPLRKQAAVTDAAVTKKRGDDRLARAEAQIIKLQRDKTEAERTAVLTQLQGQGIVLDVAEEIGDCVEMTDEVFAGHVARIKKRYARDPAGYQPIRMVDEASPPVRRQRPKHPIEEAHLARDIGGYMASHPGCDFKTAESAVMAERNGKV